MLASAIAALAEAPAGVAGVLQLLVPLYALRRIQTDMAFLLTEVRSNTYIVGVSFTPRTVDRPI